MKPNASLVPCSSCGSRACRWLPDPRFHGAVRVLPRAMDVPSDCPLVVTDRLVLESLLANAMPSELDRMVCEMQTSVRMSGDSLASPVVQARVPSRQILMETWSARRCRIMGCLPGQAVPDWCKPAPPSALPAAPAPSPAQIVDMLAQAKPIKKAAKGLMPSLPKGLDIPALPELPSVSLPSISAPSLGLGLAASNAMGSLSLPALPDLPKLPSISLPSVSAPSLDLGIKAPNVSSLKAPDLPDLPHLPNISLPSISIPTGGFPSNDPVTSLNSEAIKIAGFPKHSKTYKVLIAFDGTNNNRIDDTPIKKESNIAKFYELYDSGDDLNFKFYYEGVGTGSYVSSDPATGGFDGRGAQERIKRAFIDLRLIVSKMMENDQIDIYLMGFSRGAATARSFVNQLFSDPQKHIGRPSLPFDKIKFMGLFDTVGSFGMPGDDDEGVIPFLDSGHDLTVHSSRISKLVHLRARDEKRGLFPFTSIWQNGHIYSGHLPKGWNELTYPGVHSDIGGGYDNQEAQNQLKSFEQERQKSSDNFVLKQTEKVNLGQSSRYIGDFLSRIPFWVMYDHAKNNGLTMFDVKVVMPESADSHSADWWHTAPEEEKQKASWIVFEGHNKETLARLSIPKQLISYWEKRHNLPDGENWIGTDDVESVIHEFSHDSLYFYESHSKIRETFYRGVFD